MRQIDTPALDYASTVMPSSLLLAQFKRAILFTLLALIGWTAILIAHAFYSTGRLPATMRWATTTTQAQGFLLLVSFAAFTALDHPRLRLPAIAGMVAAALMLAVVPVCAWWKILDLAGIPPSPPAVHVRLYQLVATGVLSAGLMCLIPFILVPQNRRVARILQFTTILYLSFAYLAAILYLWQIDTQRLDEVLTTLLIPAGACMLGIFALNKFLAVRHPDPLSTVAPALHVRCPRCQCEQSLGLGESRCRCCRLRFSIAVEEPRCPNCHFNLHQLTRPICPECGFHLDADDVPALIPPSDDAAATPTSI
jgi:hypothetical protein